MKIRRTAAVVGTMASIVSISTVAGVGPAQAANDSTVVTFTITGGDLAISAPDTADLGSFATGSATASGSLGAVTVADGRGAILGNWTATADSTAWTYKDPNGSANASYDLPKTSGAYLAGAVTATGGGIAAGAGGVFGVTPVVAAARVGNLVGNSSATWSPTITVIPGAQAPAGTYTATITHSVT